jgi:hypothetical protein
MLACFRETDWAGQYYRRVGRNIQFAIPSLLDDGDLRRPMKTRTKRPFEYLGLYVLPSTPVIAGVACATSALVVLHLEIPKNARGTAHSVATAMLLLGKGDVNKGAAGLPQLLCAAGVTQPSTKTSVS